MTMRQRLKACGAACLLFGATGLTAGAAPPEQLCVKKHGPDLKGLTVACYSDAGCKYVEALGAETVRDYDTKSVPFALGREKIEGIVTSSAPIMKQITGYGYVCKAIKP
jgi:hypothetical protein